MHVVHIGRQVPKHFKDGGWVETQAAHLGHGVWMFTLEKVKDGKRQARHTNTTTPMVETLKKRMAKNLLA